MRKRRLSNTERRTHSAREKLGIGLVTVAAVAILGGVGAVVWALRKPTPEQPDPAQRTPKKNQKKLNTAEQPSPGLTNMGNTCYMNAAVQFLARLGFVQALLQKIRLQRNSFLEALYQTLVSLNPKPNTASVVRPSDLVDKTIQRLQGIRGQQQDATEFIILVVQALVKRCPIQMGKYLGITREMKLECSNCTYRNVSSAVDLTIELKELGPLQKMVDRFAKETTQYNDKCTQCGRENTRSSVKTVVHPDPHYLIINTKRDRYDAPKDLTPVAYGPTLLFGQASYKLIACIFHHGRSMNSGHYTSATLHENQWYIFDDAYVKRSSGFPEFQSDIVSLGYILHPPTA